MNGRKRMLAVGVLAGVVVGGSGLAVATAASDSVLIQACVSSTGSVRIISGGTATPTPTSTDTARALAPTSTPAPGECRLGETLMFWNQVGPQGDTGPAGEAGPKGETGATGPAGSQGEPGVSGFEMVYASTMLAANEQRQIDVKCPAGKVALSGHYRVTTQNGGLWIYDLKVAGQGVVNNEVAGNNYFLSAWNPTSETLRVSTAAACAKAS
ncbi:hypothetical protein ACIBF6_40745 [Streptosporangium amethystogenes]|uniref:hypothetical protein n=1 Tax=Streptosporangium amethystogenes TaxID=2002 RepID=UPI0037963B47